MKMIISDAHIPFQDPEAINIMLKIHQHRQPETVIINGDMIDFREISHFTRDKLVDRPISESITVCGDIIRKLQRYSVVIYHEGNHEARLQKYLLSNAPEVEHLIKFDKLINDELDVPIEVVSMIGKDVMKEYFNNQLLVGHFNKASKHSCYTAKQLVDQYKMSVLQGHTHRLGLYYVTGKKNTYIGIEGGCLCDLHPEYIMNPNWQGGFVMARDAWNIEIVYIHEGRSIYRGKVYKC